MRNWFKVEAKADAPPEITIYDEIGAWGVTAKDFIAELKKIDAKQITVSINSPGGSVFDALAIYNALRAHDASVTTKVMGVAASAASVIAMAGTKVLMAPTALMMVHNPLTVAIGDSEEMQKAISMLDEVKESIINAYELKTGQSRTKLSHLMDAETWLNANKAIELGFADGILEDEKKRVQSDDVTYAFSRRAVTNSLLSKVKPKIPKQNKGTPIESLEKRLSLISH